MEVNKIYNENCLDTMKRMPDNFIDLTVTSPPYDNLRDYKGYSFPFEDIAKELYRVTKQGGVVVWVVGDATIEGSETGTSFKQALFFKECGFNLHDTMIYLKQGFANPSSNRYHQVFEYMFVFSKGVPKTFNGIKDKLNNWGNTKTGNTTQRQKDGSLLETGKRDIDLYGMRYNVWEVKNEGGWNNVDENTKLHPATFPQLLAFDHIKSWSNENDLIYDCFMGSGTTAKAAIAANRKYIGSEISKEYYDIIQKRLQPMLHNLFT
jgi:site-specific DNA-methyltransferase (adenine-specific)